MSLAEPAAPDPPSGRLPPAAAPLSPLTRAVRVFANPARAWDGLSVRSQWWFPLVLIVVLEVTFSALTFDRALLPDMQTRWEQAVSNGQMQPDQMDNMVKFFTQNPMSRLFVLGPIVIVVPLVLLIEALIAWFGVGFVLGSRFTFGNAFGVIAWSGLVTLPASLVRYGYGWFRGSFEGLHLGLGVLLPEPDTPTKLHKGLTVFLDAISPFAAWYLVVVVLGTAALSGAPRRNIAWVLVTLYLAFVAFSAAIAAFFSPGT